MPRRAVVVAGLRTPFAKAGTVFRDATAAELARHCTRPGAGSVEAFECLQAFGALPYGINGQQVVVADAPDADELLQLAADRGYLMWVFRPISGGIWAQYADDATLTPEGRRPPG